MISHKISFYEAIWIIIPKLRLLIWIFDDICAGAEISHQNMWRVVGAHQLQWEELLLQL